jgi:hypothetical protein
MQRILLKIVSTIQDQRPTLTISSRNKSYLSLGNVPLITAVLAMTIHTMGIISETHILHMTIRDKMDPLDIRPIVQEKVSTTKLHPEQTPTYPDNGLLNIIQQHRKDKI